MVRARSCCFSSVGLSCEADQGTMPSGTEERFGGFELAQIGQIAGDLHRGVPATPGTLHGPDRSQDSALRQTNRCRISGVPAPARLRFPARRPMVEPRRLAPPTTEGQPKSSASGLPPLSGKHVWRRALRSDHGVGDDRRLSALAVVPDQEPAAAESVHPRFDDPGDRGGDDRGIDRVSTVLQYAGTELGRQWRFGRHDSRFGHCLVPSQPPSARRRHRYSLLFPSPRAGQALRGSYRSGISTGTS